MTALLPWLICALGAMFYAYEFLLRIAPSVMMDDLANFFHIHSLQKGNLNAFYYYVYAPMQLCVGVLMDRYGPRRLLTLATISCVIGSLLFASTQNFAIACIGRAVIGFGSAFAFVGVLKLATLWLPKRYFALFSGLATALGMVGAIAGDIFLTRLNLRFGWQHTIYLSAICGVVLSIFLILFVRDHGADHKKSASTQVATLDDAIAGLLNMIASPQMWIVGLIGSLLYLPVSAFAELWGIPFLKQGFNLSPMDAAMANTMVFWGWVFGGPLSGWVSDRLKRRNLILSVPPLMAIAVMLIILYKANLSYLSICAALFVFGICTSVQSIVFAVGRELNSLKFAATACSFVNFVVMLGGMVFQPLLGKLLDMFWDHRYIHGLQHLTLQNYRDALLIVPVAILLSSFLSLFILKETYGAQNNFDNQNDENLNKGKNNASFIALSH